MGRGKSSGSEWFRDPGKREHDCSRKKRYTSARQARKHAGRVASGRLRVYDCPYCHGYHVTFSRTEGEAHDNVRGRKRRRPNRRTEDQ